MSRSILSDKSVRTVTLIDAHGNAQVIHKRKRGKGKGKKQSLPLKPMEKLGRKAIETARDGASNYLGKHKRSNKKKKDGWVQDMGPNVFKANRKALKKARKSLTGA